MSVKSPEPTHLKIVSRFDLLAEFGDWLSELLRDYQNCRGGLLFTTPGRGRTRLQEFWRVDENTQLKTLRKKIEGVICRTQALQENYLDLTSGILALPVSQEGIENYYKVVVSENVVNEVQLLWNSLLDLVKELELWNGFRKREMKASFRERLRALAESYSDNRIDLPPLKVKNDRNCTNCKDALILFPNDSELRCLQCGLVERLEGTLFEDNQFFNQQITLAKHKKHDPDNHCQKWIFQLQGKENKVFTPEQIDQLDRKAVRGYTHLGILRSMHNMKCSQIRGWLKELRLSSFYGHAPLLRRIITGLHGAPVSPPQLSTEEEQLILADFSEAVAVFEGLSKNELLLRICNKAAICNKLYYPFFLLKILKYKLKGDARLPGLVECIHFQSSGTLRKDDMIWEMICPEIGYDFEPTDPTILIEIV